MLAGVPTGLWLVPTVAVLVGWYSTWDYARATLAGTLRPSLTSWGVWTATAALGTGTAWAAGSGVGVVVSAATCLRCAQALTAAGYVSLRDWRRTRRRLPPLAAAPEHNRAQRILDLVCLAACGGVGVAWWVTDDAVLGLVLAIVVDGVAAIPTIYHGWQGQEHPKPYLLGMIGPVVALLCIPQRVLADYAWPLWELGINILMVAGPLIVGWPGHRATFAVRVGGPLGTLALYTAACLTVFTVIPPPGGRFGQEWRGIAPGVLWPTVFAAAAALTIAAVIVPHSWAVAHRRARAHPAPWAAAAVTAVAALVFQIRFGGLALTVQAAILAAVLVQMAAVTAAAAWTGAPEQRRRAVTAAPPPGTGSGGRRATPTDQSA